MVFDADDEILQDFLVESSEILEQLNEQLVDLEQAPDDTELLNAVFRGFHTIKGGAGFLNLTPLVEVCHRAEDVFNLLRSGERHVTPQLMDTMLPVLDVVNAQFEALRAGQAPEPADPALLEALEALKQADDAAAPALESAAPVAPPATGKTQTTSEPPLASAAEATPLPVVDDAATAAREIIEGDITDEEFEALLDALEKPRGAAAADAEPGTAAAGSDEISEAEFESLLDELHGRGRHGGVPKTDSTLPAEQTAADVTAAPTAAADDEITEAEFEALLDELHGKGKFSARPPVEEPERAVPPEPAAPRPGGSGRVDSDNAPEAPTPAATATLKPAARKKTEAVTAEASVRVDTRRLDDIMNMVGELVLVRNRLLTLANVEQGEIAREEVAKSVANLDVVTGDLQTSVMKTRMQPIKKVFGRFPRVVRDLARSLRKEVNLVMEGEETDLDKNLVEALADPLVHLVRNAVDHGIEEPAVREAAGKPRQGVLRLAAEQEGDHILLRIEDDGAGMDPDLLRAKAVEKGLMDEEAAARLEEREVYMLIFAAGFSTKTEISDVSGRGVGMDVVKTRIAQLNGSVAIDSQLGKGTRLTIKVPLTLAIMPTLMVKLSGQRFALPLVNVSEIFHLDLTRTNVVDGQRVVVIRERALPLFYLTRWLVKTAGVGELPNAGHVVMVHVGTQQVGFVVDELIGQEEVVIKPLGAMLHGTEGIAGATITGEGGIALILDIPGLMKAYADRHA